MKMIIQSVPYKIVEHFIEKKLVIICPNWGILKFKLKLKEDLSMNKFIFNDYFHEPQRKIAKRMLFKSDNVIAFVLNIAKGEILPGHTHLESTLFFQVMEGNAKVITDGNETSLQVGELMQVDGKESVQIINIGEDVLRLYVTISPMGSEAFATDANV